MQIQGGVASTTHVDYHGDRMTKDALDSMADQIKAKFIPLLIDHDFDRQIGVNLSARVVGLEDGEYALLMVSGIFDDEAEAKVFQVGAENTVWADYEPVLDDVEALLPELPSVTGDDDLGDEADYSEDIAGQLERHLDTTSVTPDGVVYLIKRRVASFGDLQVHVYVDHDPPHFHVTSTQRQMDARFYIETLEVLDMKHGSIKPKEIKQVKDFFQSNPNALAFLRSEHARLNDA